MLVTDEPALRRHWHPVLESTSVAGAPVRAKLLGRWLVVWRTQEGVRAAIDRCPHRGAELSAGWLDDQCRLVCPYHAWAYGDEGRAVHIPQLDQSTPIPPRAQLDMAFAAERYGYIWVALEAPTEELPVLPGVGEPGWRVVPEFFETWFASAPRIIDNSLDIAHTSVVHRATIGDWDQPRVRHYEVEQTSDGFRAEVPVDAQGVEAQGAESNSHAVRDVVVEIVGVFSFFARIRYATGIDHVIYTIATPVDDRESLFVQFVGRNDGVDPVTDPAADRGFLELDRRVTEEDRILLERTAADFPLDITAEVHLRCDRITVEYRRYLKRLLRTDAVHDGVLQRGLVQAAT